ncbi:GDSL-type esterase/lipase family protein [Halobacillus sp. Marseille-Q1614]|uniref:GDSL-type esterase/lipase family protein n=1 Tax=Halobacillus sp. Marseille-Q1614 TaxID=2709134 RepID=UPI00156E4D64|nr:GDSL-type esterase/lipase family protein [Halobacillus sp. Marseille-Q1614]
MKQMKKLSAFLLVFVLLISVASAVSAKGPVKKEVDYVALGDSLAYGITPDNKPGSGYPDYLVDRLEQSQYTVDYANFAVPRHTSANLAAVLNEEFVQGKIKEAEYITINIGANDLLPVRFNPSLVPGALQGVAVNLQGVLSKIDAINPDARVYVLGYYNPFPYAPEALQPQLKFLLDALNGVIQSAASENGDTYISTEKVIAKNYETYLPNPDNIHVSKEGYQAIAKEFWKKLDKSKNN